ncbi:hypothetical protein DY000_02055264 [Brassica cretica]|uniref:Protein kinase domain-containing protein n=1 Tax=Brassica cretica TaxID=69181 RepID=A0ABQ7A7F6_BRACR|nr:hypothetical protein DY000_02055264 [Brassica cretica]
MKMQNLILVATSFYLAYTQLVDGQLCKDCQTSCGKVTIEYPFGTSQGCYYADDCNFKLTCNEKEKLLFGNNFEVIDISHSGELRAMNNISYTCYGSQGNSNDEAYNIYTLTNVSLSHKNKFTIVGCKDKVVNLELKVQHLILVATFFYLAYTQLVSGQPCQTSCGTVTIEYPFGTSPGCYYADDPSFHLTCNDKEKLLFESDLEVINISHSGDQRVWNNVSYACYGREGKLRGEASSFYTLANLSLSHKNKFNVVGCNALALLSTAGARNQSSGRFSFYTLANLSLSHKNKFPLVLDWSIGNQTCEQVRNKSICGMKNSTCFDSTRRPGYNCKCLEGFEGNPYLSNEHGCQDINECTTNSTIHKHNCSKPSTCRNKVRGFDCKCQSGYRLDTTNMSCKRKDFGWATILLDVKTANILLDENLTAKVADFGASRLIPMDKEQLTTMVQGTIGYLDPEYYHTGLLNEKSDVYSFGVVVMELLTGQKALCFERPQQSKHLVNYISSAMKENRLHEVIDAKIINENSWKEINEAVRVAMECTRVTGEERPLMTEVAAKLEGLRVTKAKHQWSDQYPGDETENLVGVGVLSAQGDTSSTGYDSIKNVASMQVAAGR